MHPASVPTKPSLFKSSILIDTIADSTFKNSI